MRLSNLAVAHRAENIAAYAHAALGEIPHFPATAAAVCAPSPVIITTCIPAFCASRTGLSVLSHTVAYLRDAEKRKIGNSPFTMCAHVPRRGAQHYHTPGGGEGRYEIAYS